MPSWGSAFPGMDEDYAELGLGAPGKRVHSGEPEKKFFCAGVEGKMEGVWSFQCTFRPSGLTQIDR